MKLTLLVIGILLLLTLISKEDCPCNRVHHPDRLILLDSSKTLSGRVEKIESDIDGDIHIRLKIGDSSLLVKNNYKDENGCLVGEIVCVVPSIFTICWFYKNEITIPREGDSIEIEGPYVFDKGHNITEIHPIMNLKIIK
jgi:PHP family Zn ribbon phosphoesterase